MVSRTPAPAAMPVPTTAARAPKASPTQPTPGATKGTLPMKTMMYKAATRPRMAGVTVLWM